MNDVPIETRAAGETFAFEAYVERGRPVLLRGFAASSQACRTWSVDHLRRVLADVPVPVEVSASGDFSGGLQLGTDARRTVTMRCAEFFERLLGEGARAPIVAAGERYYARQTPLDEYAPLDRELDLPAPLADERFGRVQRQIWISGPGHVTPTHTDCWIDNFFLQITGRKSFRLWSPADAAALALRPFGEPHSRVSPVDPEHPDLARHPEFAAATAFAGTLEPGDALYIPQGWLHWLRTDELAISVSHWFNHQTDFENLVLAVATKLATMPPELRTMYLHLFRWPASILTERIV